MRSKTIINQLRNQRRRQRKAGTYSQCLARHPIYTDTRHAKVFDGQLWPSINAAKRAVRGAATDSDKRLAQEVQS